MVIISILCFVSVFLFIFSIFGMIAKVRVPEEVKGVIFQTDEEIKAQGPLYKLFIPLLRVLALYNKKLKLTKFEFKAKEKLILAGSPSGFSPMEFLALKELAAFLALILGIMILSTTGHLNLLILLIIVILGFFYPDIWLKDLTKKRVKEVIRNMPYFLDLLTLGVEAGLDFYGAIGKVVEKSKPGPLNRELLFLLQEVRLGKTRRESLQNLASRLQIREVSTFSSALIQADQLGTPLGPVLRVLSEQMRTERAQRAEKMAMEAPVKMLLPLVAFIFPTVFIILFTPIIFKLMGSGLF
ncbi:MAG: type II secretion system F family protein [Thermodesulfobacteriota bacterium]|nr:type II secretion system F family protein [Thermodesulfobacteriota bacterium]